jgi:hypothetical protein
MEPSTPGSPDCPRERQWLHISQKLEANAHLLQSQGVLEVKMQQGHRVWRIRYWERHPVRKRRTLYVGRDPEICRRVEERLKYYREQGRWKEETLTLARLSLSMRARWLQELIKRS